MSQRALVVGDVSVDWYLSIADLPVTDNVTTSYAWQQSASPAMSGNPGGAALIRQIAEDGFAKRGEGSVSEKSVVLPQEAVSRPDWQWAIRTYSFWNRMPRQHGSNERVWRMERFVGWHGQAGDDPNAMYEVDDLPVSCLFIEDANQRFRADSAHWRPALESDPEQIIVRQTGQLGRGDMWDSLTKRFADRLTLFCAIADLRREGAPISRPLSWERTAQEVVSAIRARPHLNQARRVVVMLATSGAVIVEQDQPSVVLFDPFHQEGDWETSRPGISFGAGSCAAAAILDDLTIRGESADFGDAVRKGLSAARAMFDEGSVGEVVEGGWRIAFPVHRIASIIADDKTVDSSMQIAEVQSKQGWRLFETAYAGSFRDAALQIALKGERAAGHEIPIERMGAWSSVDRIEIESVRSLRNIINEYLANSRKSRPLNLAVFGPPGSGKSFAIKQMAKVRGSSGQPISVLEFNVSQFRDVEELPAALQKVRDQAVAQSLPLVFWDEFDSMLNGKELGWLVNFLAPMQDGTFTDQGVSRPIGPAIFVFAGGTHSTMDSFRERAVELPTSKATDFLSRLRGYVNVLGPNPDGPDDQTFALRRAMLLRAMLRSRAPQIFDDADLRIDAGILRAFLDVPDYYHGSRSMESIIEMSALAGSLRFERSALPAVHQIELHVDAESFMALVES